MTDKCPKCGADRVTSEDAWEMYEYGSDSNGSITVPCLRGQLAKRDAEIARLRGALARLGRGYAALGEHEAKAGQEAVFEQPGGIRASADYLAAVDEILSLAAEAAKPKGDKPE